MKPIILIYTEGGVIQSIFASQDVIILTRDAEANKEYFERKKSNNPSLSDQLMKEIKLHPEYPESSAITINEPDYIWNEPEEEILRSQLNK